MTETSEKIRNILTSKVFILLIIFLAYLAVYFQQKSYRKLQVVYRSQRTITVNEQIETTDFYTALELVYDRNYNNINPKGLFAAKQVSMNELLNKCNISSKPKGLNALDVLLPVQLSAGSGDLLRKGDSIALGIGNRLYPQNNLDVDGFLVETIISVANKKLVLLKIPKDKLTENLLSNSQNGQIKPVILKRTSSNKSKRSKI
jgi:hypothetical protein